MNKLKDWNDTERNHIAETLRRIAKDAPTIERSWLLELALAIDNE